MPVATHLGHAQSLVNIFYQAVLFGRNRAGHALGDAVYGDGNCLLGAVGSPSRLKVGRCCLALAQLTVFVANGPARVLAMLTSACTYTDLDLPTQL